MRCFLWGEWRGKWGAGGGCPFPQLDALLPLHRRSRSSSRACAPASLQGIRWVTTIGVTNTDDSSMADSEVQTPRTPPRAGRPSTPGCVSASLGRFNPRPRAGGDLEYRLPQPPQQFQPTPPRGGRRLAAPPLRQGGEVSTHAPPPGAMRRGADNGPAIRCRRYSIPSNTPEQG